MTSNRLIQTRFPYKFGVKGRKKSNNNNESNNNMSSINENSLKKRRLHQGKIDFGSFDKKSNIRNDLNISSSSSSTSPFFLNSIPTHSNSNSERKSIHLHQQMLSDLNYKKMSSSEVLKQIQNDYYKEQETKEKKYEEYIGKIIEKNPYYIREKQNSETRRKPRRRTWVSDNEDHNESGSDDIIEIEDSIDDSEHEKDFENENKKSSRKAIVISDDDNIIISESNNDDEDSNSSQELIITRKISNNNSRKRSRIIKDEEEDDNDNDNEENENNDDNINNGDKPKKKPYMERSQKSIFDILNNSHEENNNNNDNDNDNQNKYKPSFKDTDEIQNFEHDKNFLLGNLKKGRIKNNQLSLNKSKHKNVPKMVQKKEIYINRNNQNEMSSEIDTSNTEDIKDEIQSISDESELSELDVKNKKSKGSIILFDDDDVNDNLNKDKPYNIKRDKKVKSNNFDNIDHIKGKNEDSKGKNSSQDNLNDTQEKSSGRLNINDMTNQYFVDLEKSDISNKNRIPKVKLGNLLDYVKVIKNLDNRDKKMNELKSKSTTTQSQSLPSSSTSLYPLTDFLKFDENSLSLSDSLISTKSNNYSNKSQVSPSTSTNKDENYNETSTSSVVAPSISIQNEAKKINSNNKRIDNYSIINIKNNITDKVNKPKELQQSSIDVSTTSLPVINSNNSVHGNIGNNNNDMIKSSNTIPSTSPVSSTSLMSISSLTSSIMSNKIIPFLFQDQIENLSLSQTYIPLDISFSNQNCIIQLIYSDFVQWFSKSLSFPSPFHLFQHLCLLPIQEMAKVKLSPYFSLMNAEINEDLNLLGLNYYYNRLTDDEYKNILKNKRNEVKNFLRHFDLQPIFGNYVGLTRLERYQRAVGMALLDDIYYHYYNISKQKNLTLSLPSVFTQYESLRNEMISQFPYKSNNSIDNNDNEKNNNINVFIVEVNKLIELYQQKLNLIYSSSVSSLSKNNKKEKRNKKINIKENSNNTFTKNDITIENTGNNNNNHSSNCVDIVYGNYGGFWPPQPVLKFIENCELDDKEILESINYKSY